METVPRVLVRRTASPAYADFGGLRSVVVVLARPFLNPSVNFFMTAALITQTLTLVYGLMLMVKNMLKLRPCPNLK
jgi:hypothetical protein